MQNIHIRNSLRRENLELICKNMYSLLFDNCILYFHLSHIHICSALHVSRRIFEDSLKKWKSRYKIVHYWFLQFQLYLLQWFLLFLFVIFMLIHISLYSQKTIRSNCVIKTFTNKRKKKKTYIFSENILIEYEKNPIKEKIAQKKRKL